MAAPKGGHYDSNEVQLPAEDCHFVDVGGDRATTGIGAVQLEVDEQVAMCPAQTLSGITRRILEHAMGSIHIHIVVRYIAAAVAMRGNLDVVPRFCSPILGVASNVGGVPVRAAGYRRELPGLGVAGALGAIDHRSPIRHDLVHVQLDVRYLRWIDEVNVCVVNEVSGRRTFSKGEVPTLAAVSGVGHVEFPGIVIRRSLRRVDHGSPRRSGCARVMFTRPRA